MIKFRLLQKDEIDVRVQSNGETWALLLLYKDARCDMRILDETVGATNWKRWHTIIGNNLYCTVAIWDEVKKQWIEKQDVGVESYTEKEKGQASDSFKRACFCWGIGRELYTAPTILINLDKSDFNNNGRIKTRFYVDAIEYDEKGNIYNLTIMDSNNKTRFIYDGKTKKGIKVNVQHTKEEQPKEQKPLNDDRSGYVYMELMKYIKEKNIDPSEISRIINDDFKKPEYTKLTTQEKADLLKHVKEMYK